jgi:hypothetical protein
MVCRNDSYLNRINAERERNKQLDDAPITISLCFSLRQIANMANMIPINDEQSTSVETSQKIAAYLKASNNSLDGSRAPIL